MMQELKCISDSELEKTKRLVQDIYERKKTIIVTLKKSRTSVESHAVTIEGVYPKFFIVKDEKIKANFTIQYFDLITKKVLVSLNE